VSDICEDCGDPECCVPIALGDDEPIAYSHCLERQLIAQAGLLRSVTTKLEQAADLLSHDGNPSAVIVARSLVDSVLEVLS
jgi:hypothetical protein